MTNDERILLAEFCELPECHLTRVNLVMYRVFDNHSVWKEFAPDTDANDTDALIMRLGEQGIGTDIYRRPWMESESVTVYMQGEPIEWKERCWSGDDYKLGVCQLAIPIAREWKDE